ncbi:hypothetical protein HPB48_019018 [Haemaphysalis longicornis]|uniref:Hexosyltransferase n=1 Tax=Haemaphysalis longicornis TaxID=44386 RepID=A0A9J6F6X3_HAELO|nr:hypothetical protein HPB48_019018 [Haemaphysalis longicornis]
MPRLEPIRDTESKWYLPPSVYARTSLPRYVLGAGYVVSASAVRPLFQAALETPFFYLEDIFLTGLVAEKAGVEVIHTSYLMTMNDSDAGLCKLLGTVSAHPLTPDKQRTIWRRLRNDSATSGCPSPK